MRRALIALALLAGMTACSNEIGEGVTVNNVDDSTWTALGRNGMHAKLVTIDGVRCVVLDGYGESAGISCDWPDGPSGATGGF